MKTLKLLFFAIFVAFLASCEKNETVEPVGSNENPNNEPREVTITVKAVADNVYHAYMEIPDMSIEYTLTNCDQGHTCYSVNYPFGKEDYGRNLTISMKVSIYPNGYGTTPHYIKDANQEVTIDRDKEVIFNFNE